MCMKDEKLAILVPSWDGACELWPFFCFCISKYWTDCKYDIYLVSSSLVANRELGFKETIVHPSDDKDPVSRILRAARQISYKYIMLICDDYFCYGSTTNESIDNCLQYMELHNVDVMNLEKRRGKTVIWEKDLSKMFAISTGAPCIFKRNMLIDMCEKTKAHSMREFEVRASEYVSNHREQYKICLCKNSNVMFMHGILEGYWRFEAHRLLKMNAFPMVYKTYKKFSIIHSIKAVCKAILFNIVLRICPGILKRYYKNSSSWICKY